MSHSQTEALSEGRVGPRSFTCLPPQSQHPVFRLSQGVGVEVPRTIRVATPVGPVPGRAGPDLKVEPLWWAASTGPSFYVAPLKSPWTPWGPEI